MSVSGGRFPPSDKKRASVLLGREQQQSATIFRSCWLAHPTGMYRVKNEKVKDSFSSSAEPLLHSTAFTESGNPESQAEPTNKANSYSSFI